MERSGEMEVFARVVEHGGFSAAARSLELTPSAVSKLIARLEDRLGARLFNRTTRALTLTEEGETFHLAALRVVQELDEAERAASRERGDGLRGRLRISASVPFGRLVVTPAVATFVALHPQVQIDLSLTDDIVDLIAQRTDIAIRTGSLRESGLMARKLHESRMVVCASPAYLARSGTPRTPEDLREHTCLKFNFRPSAAHWTFKTAGGEIEQPIRGDVYVNNGDTMRDLVLAGAGIARLAHYHVAPDFAAGALVPLLEAFNPGDIELLHAIYVGGGNVPRRVRAFIDHLLTSRPAPAPAPRRETDPVGAAKGSDAKKRGPGRPARREGRER